jgi:hypothetical protein
MAVRSTATGAMAEQPCHPPSSGGYFFLLFLFLTWLG